MAISFNYPMKFSLLAKYFLCIHIIIYIIYIHLYINIHIALVLNSQWTWLIDFVHEIWIQFTLFIIPGGPSRMCRINPIRWPLEGHCGWEFGIQPCCSLSRIRGRHARPLTSHEGGELRRLQSMRMTWPNDPITHQPAESPNQLFRFIHLLIGSSRFKRAPSIRSRSFWWRPLCAELSTGKRKGRRRTASGFQAKSSIRWQLANWQLTVFRFRCIPPAINANIKK